MDIDSPFFWIKAKCFQGPLLTEGFGLVDDAVSTVIPFSWVAFRILIWRRVSDIFHVRMRVLVTIGAYSALHFQALQGRTER